jgi:hypothetical protein
MDIARIHLLWHEQFGAGRQLAREVFNWFRLPNGAGIPVSYRCERLDGKLVPLPLERAQANLIVILVEEHMVTDPEWRNFLTKLAEKSQALPQRVLLYVVALHPTAYNLPRELRALNFLSPLPSAGGRGAQLGDVSTPVLAARLLKQLTEAFARVFVRRDWTRHALPVAEAEPPKVRIFLSHAKADGGEEARQLRDYIYSETQLSAFFDENDIGFGNRFGRVLEETLESEAAALIAIEGDAYASRPWCRREVRLFREPRNLALERFRQAIARARRGLPTRWPRPTRSDLWIVQPVLVINTMSGKRDEPTTAIAELGNSPMLRWQEEKKYLYINALLRETILRSFSQRVAESLPRKPGRLIINWAPDPLSIHQLLRNNANLADDFADLIEVASGAGAPFATTFQSRSRLAPALRGRLQLARLIGAQQEGELAYPDGALSGVELDYLRDCFPHLHFLSYGEVQT